MVGRENEANAQTISGPTFDDCKRRLFDLYGTNYRVLSKRPVRRRSGPFKLMEKDEIEVQYVVNEKKETSTAIPSSALDFQRNKEALLNILQKSSSGSNSEILEIQKQLKALSEQVNAKLDKLAVTPEVKSKSIEKIEQALEVNEFTKEYINSMTDRIRSEFSLDELDHYEMVEQKVVDWIGESISLAPKKVFRPPHIIVIVGPTGVGKTTTVAKLAAQQIFEARNVGRPRPQIRMITIDRTRVAAEEQLRHYGEVMGVNVDKAETAEDVKKIYDDCKASTDVILIDTSGYSPNDSESIGKMKKILSVDGMNADIYLAVSASTKARDLRNIVQNYEPFGYTSVIITKCDETNQYGNILSVLEEKHKSVSYITDGQGVARNIKKANIIDFLIRLENFEIDRTHIDDKFGEK